MPPPPETLAEIDQWQARLEAAGDRVERQLASLAQRAVQAAAVAEARRAADAKQRAIQVLLNHLAAKEQAIEDDDEQSMRLLLSDVPDVHSEDDLEVLLLAA